MATSKKAMGRQASEAERGAAKKAEFIKALAKFLAGDQARKSILLDPRFSGSPSYPLAQEWAALRATTPLFGYGTVEEAEKTLTEWLS